MQKDTIKKPLFYLLLVLMVLSTGFFLYRTVDAFFSMRQERNGKKTLALMVSLNTLAEKAGDEALYSSRFFGLNGVNYLDQLEQSRQKVDQALQELRAKVDAAPANLIRPDRVKHYAETIRSARMRVDTLDPAEKAAYGASGEPTPIASLFAGIDPRKAIFVKAGMAGELTHYLQTMQSLQSLWDERALLSYFLARHTALTDSNVMRWEAILEKTERPAAQKPVDTRQEEAGDALAIHQHLLPVRGDILGHADDGNFAHQLHNIESVFAQPIHLLQRNQEQRIERIRKDLKQKEERNRVWLTQFLFLLILMIVAWYVVYRVLHANLREKRALEESLKEIVSELDPEQRRELESIMNQRDRSAMYRFLADMTMESRAAEERALQAEKAKDLFLANMSHEIRTPLNGILGFAQLMQGTPLNAEQEEFMGVIEGSSNNLLKIVNDILDLSKIHAEKIELESIPFSIVQQLEQTIEPHAARALEQRIEYSVFIDPTLPMVHGDPTKLSQVMTNLIGNAVKFTNEGGAVDVDIRQIKGGDDVLTVRFSIKDSGIGISAEQQQKIFEPFSQADVSTTREFGGTGLGLTITREIIERMGGTLHLMSEEGVGSEFYFELILERAGEDKNIHNRLEGVTLAYYHNGRSTLRQMERNLALYVRASGGRFKMIGDHELDLLDDVDLLLLDYTNKDTRSRIEDLLRLGKKTILLSTPTHEHETDNLSSRVERILYRPVTISKLIRAHESIGLIERVSSPEESHHEHVTLAGLNVLVAEDNPINQKLIGRILEGMEITPTLVNNGKEALEMRQAQSFDAVLMDVQMPVMGGIESTKAILNYEHKHGQNHVPIIALTANALQGDRERYLREGFDDYISKPVNLDQLRQVLKKRSGKLVEVESPLMDDTDEENDNSIGLFNFHTVMMYSRSKGLVQRIHHDALLYAGHTFYSVGSEAVLLEMMKSKRPDAVVIDTYSVALDDCELIEAIQNDGAELYLYGHLNPLLNCATEAVTDYTSVSTLLNLLR